MSSTIEFVLGSIIDDNIGLDTLLSDSYNEYNSFFELLVYLHDLIHTQRCYQYEIIDLEDKINRLNIMCDNYAELIDIINVNYNKLNHAFNFRKKININESVDFEYEINNISNRFNKTEITDESLNINHMLDNVRIYIDKKNSKNKELLEIIETLQKKDKHSISSYITQLQEKISIHKEIHNELHKKRQTTIKTYNKQKQIQESLHDNVSCLKRRYMLLKKRYDDIYNSLKK